MNNLQIIKERYENEDYQKCNDIFFRAASECAIDDIHPLTGVIVMVNATRRMLKQYNATLLHVGDAKNFINEAYDFFEEKEGFKALEFNDEDKEKIGILLQLVKALNKKG